MSLLIPKGRKVKRNRPKRLEDKRHLQFIRELPCVACLSHAPNQAHHVLTGTVRGMGLKAPDSECVPLCPTCHHNVHHVHGDECMVIGFSPIGLAKELYKASGNHTAAKILIVGWRMKRESK